MVEQIIERNTAPLRIRGGRGQKYLGSPDELYRDDLVVKFLGRDQKTVHFEVVSSDKGFKPHGFKRHFLYSRAGECHIVTASGYLFSGPVEDCSTCGAEVFHVEGDQENQTGGLDNEVEEHLRRIEDLEIDTLSLEEAMRTYNTLRFEGARY